MATTCLSILLGNQTNQNLKSLQIYNTASLKTDLVYKKTKIKRALQLLRYFCRIMVIAEPVLLDRLNSSQITNMVIKLD